MARERDSLLELYRIIVMLAIVGHHYVVNSGVLDCVSGWSGLWLRSFGAWGKVGINCFVLITGYYMCASRITLKKFLKLVFEVLSYKWIIGIAFWASGNAPLAKSQMISFVLPVASITDGFVGCFLVFFLAIPFLNVLVNNLSKRQHQLLLALTIGFFSLMPTYPLFPVRFNYVEWFCILYFVASYLRKYPSRWTENRKLWVWMSVVALLCGVVSVVGLSCRGGGGLVRLPSYYFLIDSNKFTALAASLCFFLAFKPSQRINDNSAVQPAASNLEPRFYSPLVNTIASTTFGVLLIHANSDAMRRWLWGDVCNVVGWYKTHGDSMLLVMAHAVGCTLAVFAVCAVIDLLRQRFVERPLFGRLFPD